MKPLRAEPGKRLVSDFGVVSVNVVPKMESVGVKKLFQLVQQKPNAWKQFVLLLLLIRKSGFFSFSCSMSVMKAYFIANKQIFF